MKKGLLHIAIAALLLIALPSGFASNPSLGVVAEFVLFTSDGALLNTAGSHLTGSIGTNNGSISGFGNVNGNVHNSDGLTATAASDLLAAYNSLNSAIPTFFPAPLLGDGQILTPGIYSINQNATLNNVLTLDGQGDENAQFTIKIQGTLSTGALAEVVLLNNAKACNVFWKTEGLISLATGTKMKGNLIANNAAIVLAIGVELEGRALSTTGAITTNGVVATTTVGCGSLVLNGPTAPDLKTISCFAIFSGNGEVTNTGTTYLTGSVGTNVGLTTGFEELKVTGTIHPVPDVATGVAISDLNGVQIYLNNLPIDIELLYPAQFGNNLVLTPHTYLLNAATFFTNTLYLNAMGNADAVFVIKINGALTTSTYAQVILQNGAQAKNVYWYVSGAVEINENSDFKGNIVVNTGAINIKAGTTLLGRALTTSGAITTTAISVSMPSPCVNLSTNIENSTNNKLATILSGNSGQAIEIQLVGNESIKNSQLFIYNTIGRLLVNTPITQSKTIISSNLPTGIYFYKLSLNNSFQKGKFIVK